MTIAEDGEMRTIIEREALTSEFTINVEPPQSEQRRHSFRGGR
jgi:hypothetical protein